MTEWIDQLDDTELKVFNGELRAFPNDEAVDGAIIKWLDAAGRTADIVTVRLHRYFRDSGSGDVTGADFLAFCDANNVQGFAGSEGKECLVKLRDSEDYQAEPLNAGDYSFLLTAWRTEVDNERDAIWGEWWDAWQEARRGYGLVPEQGGGSAGGRGERVTVANEYADTADVVLHEDASAPATGVVGNDYVDVEAAAAAVASRQQTAQGGFEGAHAWVNDLDPNQWNAFSGEDHTGVDHDAAMRVWANATGRSEVTEAIGLYDYLMSLAGPDSTTTGPDFLAWYDGGWSSAADTETRARVERLRTADAATQADPAQVGSCVHPWRRSLRAQLDGSSDQWWADWQAAQRAGGYSVGVKPATTPLPPSAPAVTLPDEYAAAANAEHGYEDTMAAQAVAHGYEDTMAAQAAGQPLGGDASGYLDADLDNLPPVTDEDDEDEDEDEEDGADLPDVQADEHGYVHNLDALSQVESPGDIVRGYAEDNALDKLFAYFNANDMATVLASVQQVDGGAALDGLARSYPTEFVGWFDAAAGEAVQSALLARPVIAGVVRAHRAAADPRSRQPRKDAAASEPARMKLQPAQLDQIDVANKAAIASIERGGGLTWYAGGVVVLIGQNHDAAYLSYYDDQPDRVSGKVIVRRVRIGTGPVVFFDVPPAKQELVTSAARRATSRKPVFESGR